MRNRAEIGSVPLAPWGCFGRPDMPRRVRAHADERFFSPPFPETLRPSTKTPSRWADWRVPAPLRPAFGRRLGVPRDAGPGRHVPVDHHPRTQCAQPRSGHARAGDSANRTPSQPRGVPAASQGCAVGFLATQGRSTPRGRRRRQSQRHAEVRVRRAKGSAGRPWSRDH